MLSERQKKLLTIILKNPRGIKGAELAEKIHVTTRTVRNDIADINMTLMNSHCMIQSSKRAGYFIMKENVVKIQECLSLMDAIDSRQIASTPIERRYYLLGQVALHSKISLFELADMLYVSEQTVYKDVMALIRFLKDTYHFCEISVSNGNVILQCDEVELRSLCYRIIKDEIYLSDNLVNLHLYQLVKESYDIEELNDITDYIVSYCKGHDITLTDRMIFVISWMIFFTFVRIQNGSLLKKKMEVFHQNISLSTMLKNLIDDLRFDFNEDDCNLLQNYIETLGFYSNDDISDVESDGVVEEFTRQMKIKYNYDFTSIPTLYDNFRNHLNLAIKRLLVDYQLSNPLLQEVKTKYSFAYEIALMIAPILYEKYGLYMCEDEISFLALYVMPFLKMQNICLRVILVNSVLQSFTSFIEIWLKQEFQDHLKIVAITPLYSLQEEIKKTEADLIISTTSIDFTPKLPVITISSLPGINEKKMLEEFMEGQAAISTGMKIFREVFSKEKILFFHEDIVFEEVIKQCAQNLKKQGHIEDDELFLQTTLSREKVYPTHISNGVYLPHPLMNQAIRSGISVGVVKKETTSKDDKIKLFFVLAQEPTINNDMIYIYNLINKIAVSEKLVNVLLDLQTSQEFIDYLERIIQIM